MQKHKRLNPQGQKKDNRWAGNVNHFERWKPGGVFHRAKEQMPVIGKPAKAAETKVPELALSCIIVEKSET